jgi:hypothetical protein
MLGFVGLPQRAFRSIDLFLHKSYFVNVMTAIAQKLDERLRQWEPRTAREVELCIGEIIDLADHDALDLLRSRQVEQEVLDILDEPKAR